MFHRDIIDYLEKWKVKSGRKPLVLRGARQVGKTSAVKIFAAKHFTDFIHINLEKAEDYELFKDIKSLSDFEKTVNIVLGKKIIPDKTLVFIDEIQNAPSLIELLRFFYEELPRLHLIAAGSLLEVKVKEIDLAMPVGRIEYAYVHPLTFFEFLKAVGERKILDFLKEINLKESIPRAIHERALKLFNDYALVGGMPEIVARYNEKIFQEDLNILYSSLLTAYAEDIYKYASSADVKYIRHVMEQAPYFAGERITYEKFGGSGFRSREMGEAFRVLEKTMLLRQLPATKSRELPLIGQRKRAKKLLYLDVGFVNFKNNIQSEFVGIKDLSGLYRGKIAEQVVGQNLIANAHLEQPLFYWAKEKPQGSAEVDFCLSHEGNILGIEVKSGHAARLRSLLSFGLNVESGKLIRIYSGPLKKENISSAGREYELLSAPFYLVNRIFDFC